MNKTIFTIAKGLLLLILVNVLANFVYTRIDLTEDKRYTLTSEAIQATQNIDAPVIIDVLLDGNLPPEFLKLKSEVKELLLAFEAKNNNVKFSFVNPLEGAENVNTVVTDLQTLGLTPTQITVENKTEVSQNIVFPWAMVNYKNTTVKVPLLKNRLGASTEERVNNSVQHLEYAFADAFTKVSINEKKKIAIIKGNGELADIHLADFLTTIRDYYNIGAITLDSVETNPRGTLNKLKNYDLAIIAKPQQAFSEKEKYVLDQYIVNGGKSLWLIDQVQMELDSLFNEKGTAMALGSNLNLNDFLFNYGVRINPTLVNDMYFTQIVLASGDGNAAQYNPVPWVYHPMVFSKNNHPINNNIEALKFQFANAIDTISNANKKTILLQSSPLSKVDGTPKQISLSLTKNPPKKEHYVQGNNPLAVLIEGDFKSAYANRVKPVNLNDFRKKGEANKMIVISDGDLIKNQLRNGRPLELGYDKWTNNFYGNKEFLVNSVNYLLDDTGLINIRNKKVAIPFLDEKKIEEQKTKWQLINIGTPIVLVLLFGFIFSHFRKRKYAS